MSTTARLPILGNRQVFVYRWGNDDAHWKGGKPTPDEALEDLQRTAESLKAPPGGWEVGAIRQCPPNGKRVTAGDLLIFYAGAKFSQRGVYGIGIAKPSPSGENEAVWYDAERPGWRLPFQWLPASKNLARRPRFQHLAALFAPSGPSFTILRLDNVPTDLRDFLEGAVKVGVSLPKFAAKLTIKEKDEIASVLEEADLPAKERKRATVTLQRLIRDARLRPRVLKRWFPKSKPVCAFCGRGLSVGEDLHEVEIAHVREVQDDGYDQERNALPVCRTHHWAFDNHVIAIEPDTLTIRVRPSFAGHAMLQGLRSKIVRPSAPSGVEVLADKELRHRWKIFQRKSR